MAGAHYFFLHSSGKFFPHFNTFTYLILTIQVFQEERVSAGPGLFSYSVALELFVLCATTIPPLVIIGQLSLWKIVAGKTETPNLKLES